jgi:exopolysaccharide production protein ExoQ
LIKLQKSSITIPESQGRLSVESAWPWPFLAKASLFLYLFFLFFGTSMPFQERVTDAGEIITSNFFNQIVFSFLYVVSLVALVSKRRSILPLMRAEKFLTLFLLWSFLSIFWSEYSFVSFKRWLQLAGSFIIFLSAMLHMQSNDEAMKYCRWILMFYIPATLLSILLIPSAIQWEFPAWRGLAPHKNLLGQLSLMSLLVWTHATHRTPSFNKRCVAFLFLVLSIVLLAGSQSSTSFIIGAALLILATVHYLQGKLLRISVAKFYPYALFIFVLFSVFSLLIVFQDLRAEVFDLLGKDQTLTGRDELWESVLNETRKNWLAGCGFGGFWVVGSPAIDSIFKEFVWFPNQAHSGYVDLLNETGIIGISILAMLIISYFLKLHMHDGPHYYKWFLIAVLLLNISESTLFVPNTLTGSLFIFAYLALFKDISLNRKRIHSVPHE